MRPRRFRWRECAILLTSPVVDATPLKRLCGVAAGDPAFVCAVDHPDPVAALATEAHRRSLIIDVVIDVDVGLARTGVAGPDEARRLADHIARYPALALTGVQGYGGHWQHIEGFDERREAVSAGMKRLNRGPVRLTLPTP